MIGRTPVAAETWASQVWAHAVSDAASRPLETSRIEHREQVPGHDRGVLEEPGRLVRGVVRRRVRVRVVVRPDGEAGSPRT